MSWPQFAVLCAGKIGAEKDSFNSTTSAHEQVLQLGKPLHRLQQLEHTYTSCK